MHQVPRFNYDEYMKSLTEKISGIAVSGHAPNANAHIGGADFQAYLLRERTSYLKSVHEFGTEGPLIQSLSKIRELDVRAARDDEYSPDVNSLHYQSRGLSSDN